MVWLLDGKPFEPTNEFLDDYIGFVYVVTDLHDGTKYLGSKQFRRKIRRPPLKGKKRVRICYVESDWRTYAGSSPDILNYLKENESGLDRYQREILMLCKSKAECNYHEARLQFELGVLLDPSFKNEIINCRIHRKHLVDMSQQNVVKYKNV